jgi:metal-responsive CopG/Arc/MetJ family transcriptional regulator
MSKQQICVNLEKSLIAQIDQSRGDVPRSRVVERALVIHMDNMSKRMTLEKMGMG